MPDELKTDVAIGLPEPNLAIRWIDPQCPPSSDCYYRHIEGGTEYRVDSACYALIDSDDLALAHRALGAGCAGVLLGETALRQPAQIRELVEDHGGKRVGVMAQAARMQVSWTMDCESNADFRFMRPSVVEPCWELLTVDGKRTGTRADWWFAQMFKLGVGTALLRVDVADAADLNLCATLRERFQDGVWFAPLSSRMPRIRDMVELAGVRQLALPPPLRSVGEAMISERSAIRDPIPATVEANE